MCNKLLTYLLTYLQPTQCASFVMRTGSQFGKRAFSVRGPNIWNQIPPHTRNLHSAPAFRKALNIFFCFRKWSRHCNALSVSLDAVDGALTTTSTITIKIIIRPVRKGEGVWGVRRLPNSQKYTKKVHIVCITTQHDQHQLTNFGQQVRLLLKLHLIWSVDSAENHGKGCHQRSDFMAKMHQIRFRLGLRPRPRWGAHSAPQTP